MVSSIFGKIRSYLFPKETRFKFASALKFFIWMRSTVENVVLIAVVLLSGRRKIFCCPDPYCGCGPF